MYNIFNSFEKDLFSFSPVLLSLLPNKGGRFHLNNLISFKKYDSNLANLYNQIIMFK